MTEVVTAIDVWPARAQYRPGEPIGLRVAIKGTSPGSLLLRTRIVQADGTLTITDSSIVDPGVSDDPAELVFHLPLGAAAGYAAEVVAETDRGALRATTAFDVAPHWSAAPRYGFFSDFTPEETVDESNRRADHLLRLHVNVVQFYDWMASHHTFLPETDEFTDPLGRRLSHEVVRRKVALAHERGMASLAYGALYGAEAEFSREHPDWLLYDGRHEPLALADIFYLQDFGPRSPWREWIVGQYEQAVDVLGFDGIHIDQYGYPKSALSRLSGRWRTFDVGAAFPGFVEEAASRILKRRPEGGSIFNCVNAWPLEAMAPVRSDAATYIEVWEPHTRYRDLYDLVRRARLLRPDKQVILAAYLLPFHPDTQRTAGALTAFRLASAAIGASGGFHLISGEGAALLSEAYYPRHGQLDQAEAAVVRRYADFAVRNTGLLHGPATTDIAWTHVGPTNDVIVLSHPDLDAYGAGAQPGSLWVIGRELGDVTVLQLVNLRGLTTDAWNTAQERGPSPLTSVEVRVRVVGGIDGVWFDTPDDDVGLARPVPFDVTNTAAGRFLVFRIPRIDVWSTVWWKTEQGGQA